MIFLIFPTAVKADSLIDLQKQAAELENQINKYQKDITNLQGQAQTLKRDLSILDDEISQTKLKIQQTELAIQMTEFDIGKKTDQIRGLDQKIIEQKNILAQNIRTVYYYDQESLLEILLSKEELSDVLSRVQALEVLQKKMHESLNIIRANKSLTIEDKIKLEDKEEEQVSLRKLQEFQKRTLQKQEADKKYILTKTQGQEVKYKKLLSQKEVELELVKQQITLLQSQGKQTLGWEEWVSLSKKIENRVGVRAALLMAILDQETSVGKNLGSCYLRDAKTGNGIYKENICYGSNCFKRDDKAPKTMKPMGLYGRRGDVDDFLEIVKKLNLAGALKTDWQHTQVSCCMVLSNGTYYGWGGAMGPAQIIPTTWKSIEKELKTYITYPNPWMPEDAVTAMALLLRRNGALIDEERAACAYFGNCKEYNYGKSVIKKANAYQKLIDQRN